MKIPTLAPTETFQQTLIGSTVALNMMHPSALCMHQEWQWTKFCKVLIKYPLNATKTKATESQILRHQVSLFVCVTLQFLLQIKANKKTALKILLQKIHLFQPLFYSSVFVNTLYMLLSALFLSLVVFSVMEWLLRTWLLCLTLVDEVCLCLPALTCRNRDTAYSKINTQSRRERGREREVKKRKRREGDGVGCVCA